METYIEKQQKKRAQVTEKIKQVLQLNDYSYNNNILEYAYLFLDRTTGGYEVVSYELMRKKAFWQWWKNQFFIVDEVFLNFYKSEALSKHHVNGLEIVYREMHVNMRALPDSIIYQIDMEYSKMIKTSIKKEVK